MRKTTMLIGVLGAVLPGVPAMAGAPEIGDQFDYAPGEAPPAVNHDGPPRPRGNQQAIFLNFDGATMTTANWDYAPANETQFPDAGGDYPPFGEQAGGQSRQAIMDAVRSHFGPYSIDITDERPTHDNYAMIVVSPRGKQPGRLGFASLNCGGNNLTGVGFAHFSVGDGNPGAMATTVSHEAAHTFGLEHTTSMEDIMYPNYTPTGDSFVDGCNPIVDNAAHCTLAHSEYCEGGGQNTHAELYGLFGPGNPDMGGPDVWIADPADRSRYEVGAVFDVLVEATDDVGVGQVRLFLDGELLGTDVGTPYDWTVDGLPEGIHELSALAIDTAGNEAMSDVITIAVGDAEFPSEPDDDGGEDDSGTGGGPLPEAEDPDLDGQGCGCALGSGGGGGGSTPAEGGILLLLAVGLGFRRRTARSGLVS